LEITPEALDVENDTLQFNFSRLDFQGSWKTDYFDAGVYLLNITVSDGKKSDWQTIKITVNNRNRLPVSQTPLTETRHVKIQERLTFTAEFLDPDDDFNSNGLLDGSETDNLTYKWDFGDGTVLEGDLVEHRYQNSGKFAIHLTVVDPDNGSFNFVVNITVEDQDYILNQGQLLIISGLIVTVVLIIIILLFLLKRIKLPWMRKEGTLTEKPRIKHHKKKPMKSSKGEQMILSSDDSEIFKEKVEDSDEKKTIETEIPK
jgi:hypothetical protein